MFVENSAVLFQRYFIQALELDDWNFILSLYLYMCTFYPILMCFILILFFLA